ncbi:MAG: hypothetical protein KDB00_00180 [Planctomycetales bacterium]|nr:hypothetical protein [Planctomycetales bacterium]
MSDSDSRQRAEEYCRSRNSVPEFDSLLGTGQEGFVWKTSRDTAVKVFDRIGNFDRELACYRIFSEFELCELDGFAIPEMLGFDEETRVIELQITTNRPDSFFAG